jgi:DNA-binding IclR family transcriptional regulator
MDTPGLNKSQDPEEIPREAPTRTLEKGLFLLGLFDTDNPEWTLKELRERAGLPKATTRRLMKTLEASHWVASDPVSGKYYLGSSVLRALYLATSHSELVRAAHPYLLRLEEETTESTSLSVWTDQGALILDTVPTTRPFKPHTFVGMLLPGHASADAQVLIAFGSEQTQEAVLGTPQLRRTENTVTDPGALREKWRWIRREGVAFDREEWRIGAPAVAAPVFDQNGELRASLSVVPPTERCSEVQMQGYAEAVKRAAAELSAELGYQAG